MKIFSLSYFVFFFVLLFGSTGMGWNAIFLTQVAELSGHKLTGTATGMAFLIINAGVILGPPLFGYLVDLTGNYKLSWGFVASCMGMVAIINKFQGKVK